jgi:hypothetical protein
MKNKIILIIGIIIVINYILCERCVKYTPELYEKTTGGPFTNTGLTCGKENPKKQTDCTKYGTDSGMYCCWVAQNENDGKGKCHLISLTKIERSGIDGCAQFTDSYWSCGNFSSYIKMKKIIFGFLVIIFLSG